MNEDEFYALADKVLQLHKENNNMLSWHPLVISRLGVENEDQLHYVRNALIQRGLIYQAQTDNPLHTRLSLDGYVFEGFE